MANDTTDVTLDESKEMYDIFVTGDAPHVQTYKGTPLDNITSICSQPPQLDEMSTNQNRNCVFMIAPFKYNPSDFNNKPTPMHASNNIKHGWNADDVRMPCSPMYVAETINHCSGKRHEIKCLEILINSVYSKEERVSFLSTTLSNICSLAMNVDQICGQSPPLLRIGSNRSVTMSQKQAASLLACAFFCLFPFRSEQQLSKEYENFQSPNFDRLYSSSPPQQIQKLKCILHYFQRITQKMPRGVITFQRFALPNNSYPKWSDLRTNLSDLHLTANKKIEDIPCTLQVDFANKFIGGGVLGAGCVQEEIRFSVCPEMLVSLLVCEVMEPNECIFLIGCERFCSYKGYSNTFEFDGDYIDLTAKDSWGRKWSHLVAMDATYFQDRTSQYDMKCISRELIKAYASFYTAKSGPNYQFGIVTGNWGCGVFNGDKQMKAIIQWMAASEAGRPLIFTAYRDKHFIDDFFKISEYLSKQGANVGHLYRYLYEFCRQHHRSSFFDYILVTPVNSLKS